MGTDSLKVNDKEVPLACELATLWTVGALDNKLVYHLKKNEGK